MLIGIDPLLSPQLLYILRAMGHGDEIAVVDANFPAESCAQDLVRLDGIEAHIATRAILSVMPLDSYVEAAAFGMEDASAPDTAPPAVQLLQTTINDTADQSHTIKLLERFAFYERAKECFAIVQTGEGRHFGNLILKKGVLPSNA